jgi:CheY-like chemotaxis protein
MDTIKKILWIDDDINRFSLMPYIDEFNEQGFTIIRVENPDEIGEKLSSNNNDFLCIIVDISMPPGEKISFGDAKGGMQTGLVILKELVEKTDLKAKKVVFTIVENAEVREYCKNKQIPYLQKHKYFTDTFVREIEEILSQNNEE